MCVNENEVHYNPTTEADRYLTFIPLEDSTFKLSINDVNYSLDGGSTWILLAANTDSPIVTAGNKIIWKGELVPNSTNGIGTFSSSGRFNIKGNPMSLLYDDDFIGKTSLTEANSFRKLFIDNTNLINANELSLSAITLKNSCYSDMFSGCTNLISAPELPATTLARGCYYNMFYNCTNLTTAPELPATILARECYYGMFMGCRSLITAPELLATASLNNDTYEVQFVYQYMFQNCTNLVYGPSILPLTTVSNSSYNGMFRNCVNLERAPEILATNVAHSAYDEMFSGCSKVNRIKHMLLTYPANPTYRPNLWVSGVSATGTFIKNASMTNEWLIGTNGIPSGWTVQTASA